MSNIIRANFEGVVVPFLQDGWVNATAVAAKYGKEPRQWLRQRETVEYIAALADSNGNPSIVDELSKISALPSSSTVFQNKALAVATGSGYVRTVRGSPMHGGGTWLHPKLAVFFARWLSARFAVWCDQKIEQIYRGMQRERDVAYLDFRLRRAQASIHGRELGKWGRDRPALLARIKQLSPQLLLVLDGGFANRLSAHPRRASGH